MIRENLHLEFRSEFFNVLNHPNFGPPDGSYGDPTFGSVLSQNGSPRDIQFALKLIF